MGSGLQNLNSQRLQEQVTWATLSKALAWKREVPAVGQGKLGSTISISVSVSVSLSLIPLHTPHTHTHPPPSLSLSLSFSRAREKDTTSSDFS